MEVTKEECSASVGMSSRLPLHHENINSCFLASVDGSFCIKDNGIGKMNCKENGCEKRPCSCYKRQFRARAKRRHQFSYLMFCLLLTVATVMAWTPPIAHISSASPKLSLDRACRMKLRCRRHGLTLLQFSTSKQPARSIDSNVSLDDSFINDLNSQLDLIQQYIDTARYEHGDNLHLLEKLKHMLSVYYNWHNELAPNNDPTSKATKQIANSVMDKAFRESTTYAFSTPYNLDKVNLGMAVLRLQLHPEINKEHTNHKLRPTKPFSSVPKATWLKALRALTSTEINSSRSSTTILSTSRTQEWISPSNAAFRILQRFITNHGIRIKNRSPHNQQHLDERDFNMVLHSYTTSSQLASAHRIMALQHHHRVPLSPVPYSILLKAYGQLGDMENVQICINHAQKNRVEPDVVMVNTVLDAYVNCGEVERAETLFHSLSGENDSTDSYWPRLRPNVRTYNTILKGMAVEGRLKEALKLSQSMQEQRIWDDITTNTLVKVAVMAQEFTVAENLLTNHTSGVTNKHIDHPNIEAYTELIDGYAKDNQLEKALEVMSRMQLAGISPNVYTYTCVVGALARNNKIRQAKKMIDYVCNSQKKRKLTPVFNAFISGLLSGDGMDEQSGGGQASHNRNILEALNTLSEMEERNITPNVVTVTLIIDGLANCNPPRCKEARGVVQHLEFTMRNKEKEQHGRGAKENSGRISLANVRIGTALIRAYGRANDADSAADAFRRITNPDVVALNALLDACCKSSQLKLAFQTFEKYTCFEKWKNDVAVMDVGPLGEEKSSRAIQPDVVTYTTLIMAVLQLKNKNASKRAAKLYSEMKEVWRISPDTVLVDKILYTMTNGGPRGFEQHDIQFTLTVLRDGEQLQWEGTQYQKRKKTVRSILMACSSEVWKNDEVGLGLNEAVPEDPLFLKKGWNKIDSGFRLWGGGDGGVDGDDRGDSSVDEFLASKGWNDMDSGFRII